MQRLTPQGYSIELRTITRLWLPLAAMWLFMGVETPLINAFIARMPAVTKTLAAFGVTYSMGLVLESPIIQMLTTGTALTTNRENYRRLMRFLSILAISLTILHLTIALTPLYRVIVSRVMGVPEDITDMSRVCFMIFFPFHAAVGFRRFWQGILIRYGRSNQVTLIMIIRFLVTSGTMVTGFLFSSMNGAVLGSLALTLGVVTGAVAALIFARPVVRSLPASRQDSEIITFNELLQFYIPLSLTSFILMAVKPVMAAGIVRGKAPLESLAVWPVVDGLLFIFRSSATSYQEVVVALHAKKEMSVPLKRFSVYLALSLGIAGIAVGVTPLSGLWFSRVAGLKGNLLPHTYLPFLFVLPIPVLSSLISYYRGILVVEKKTGTIAFAVAINSLLLSVALFSGIKSLPLSGASVAAIALSMSIAAETVFLGLAVGRKDKVVAC